MARLKTLASCKPSEFLRQANRIRKSVDRWLTVTDIINLRKRTPSFEVAGANATDEEKEAIRERNERAKSQKMIDNASDMLDSMLEEHPDETLEILALCCFVEPEDVDDYTMSEYLEAANELLRDEAVIDFFTSLVRMGSRSS